MLALADGEASGIAGLYYGIPISRLREKTGIVSVVSEESTGFAAVRADLIYPLIQGWECTLNCY